MSEEKRIVIRRDGTVTEQIGSVLPIVVLSSNTAQHITKGKKIMPYSDDEDKANEQKYIIRRMQAGKKNKFVYIATMVFSICSIIVAFIWFFNR